MCACVCVCARVRAASLAPPLTRLYARHALTPFLHLLLLPLRLSLSQAAVSASGDCVGLKPQVITGLGAERSLDSLGNLGRAECPGGENPYASLTAPVFRNGGILRLCCVLEAGRRYAHRYAGTGATATVASL